MRRKLNFKIAALLGCLMAFLWAFQHPLQNGLYQRNSGDFFNILKVMASSEVILAILFAPFFLSRRIRSDIWCLLLERGIVFKSFFLFIIGDIGLLLYAYAQSSASPIFVSIVLTASPAFAFLYSALISNREKPVLTRMGSAIKTRDFAFHLIIIPIILICIFLGSSDDLSLVDSLLPGLALIFVPFLYFLFYFATRVWFGDDGSPGTPDLTPSRHLAAICFFGFFGSFISALFLSVFSYAFGTIDLDGVELEYIVPFTIGVIISSFLGQLLLHYIHTQNDDIRGTVPSFYHFTPIFTSIIILAMAALNFDVDVKSNIWLLVAAVAIFFATLIFYKNIIFGDVYEE